MLRQDNADARLTPKGYAAGLVSEEQYAAYLKKQALVDAEIERLENTHVSPLAINPFLEGFGLPPVNSGLSLADLLRRPEMTYAALAPLDVKRPSLPPRVLTTVEVSVKYEGYIKRQIAEVARHARLEEKVLPTDIDYKAIKGLRLEAAQKLDKLRPLTIGQASRISGVNPADVSVLLIYLGLK